MFVHNVVKGSSAFCISMMHKIKHDRLSIFRMMKWLSEMTEMERNIEDVNTLMITVTLNNVGLKGRQYI